MRKRDPNSSKGKALVTTLHQQHAKMRENRTMAATSHAHGCSGACSDSEPWTWWTLDTDTTFALHRAMRTHLVGFGGNSVEDKDSNLGQIQGQVHDNIKLLKTCPAETRASIVIDVNYSDRLSRDVMSWMKHERNPEYWWIVDKTVQWFIRNVCTDSLNGKQINFTDKALLRKLRARFENGARDYKRLGGGAGPS